MTNLSSSNPKIYIISTPLGNISDMSPRSIEVLKTVDLIAAEDTRKASQLFRQLDIQRSPQSLWSYYDHVERKKAPILIEKLLKEKLSLAVISDAGTPCIADPGYHLISIARTNSIPVIPIPGASALTAMVSASGLPNDRILFVGFLPTKQEQLKKEVSSWAKQSKSLSIIFFEATRRLPQTLAIIEEQLPHCEMSIGREISKVHEEFHKDTISETKKWAESHSNLKGEVTCMAYLSKNILKSSISFPSEKLNRKLDICCARGLTQSELMEVFADEGLDRKQLYDLLLKYKENYPKNNNKSKE